MRTFDHVTYIHPRVQGPAIRTAHTESQGVDSIPQAHAWKLACMCAELHFKQVLKDAPLSRGVRAEIGLHGANGNCLIGDATLGG